MRWRILVLALLGGCTAPCGEGRICVVAGTGDLGFNGDGLDARDSRLASPTSVVVGPDGDVTIVDYSNMRLRRLAADGTLQTVVGSGIHAYSEIGVPAVESPLENPIDAAVGPDGLLYVQAQHEGRVIRIVDGLVERFAGTGELGDGGDGGPALDASLGYGAGLAFGPDGALYISDNTYHRVRRVAPDGTIDTVLGTGEPGMGESGVGPEVAIRNPERIVVDGDRLLVADAGNHRILAVDLDALEVSWLAGTGTAGDAGDGGPATEAELHTPTGLAVGPAGQLYIADLDNDALRVVEPDGTLRTAAGGPDAKDRDAGPAESFAIRRPAGLAWDGADLLIAERGGHRLLRWGDPGAR